MVGGAPMAPAATTMPSGAFEGFNSPMGPENVRVIRVPYQELRAGDLKYNIIIHAQDLIMVPIPQYGVYWVAGHVQRSRDASLDDEHHLPGVVPLAPEDLTRLQRPTTQHPCQLHQVGIRFGGLLPGRIDQGELVRRLAGGLWLLVVGNMSVHRRSIRLMRRRNLRMNP